MKYLSDVGINKVPENGVLDVGGKVHATGIESANITTEGHSVLSALSGNLKVQTGWGYLRGDGDDTATGSVSFPVSFGSPPIVIAGGLGVKGGANPSGPGDFPSITTLNASAGAITASGFNVVVTNTRGTNQSDNNRLGYSWIAIGVV